MLSFWPGRLYSRAVLLRLRFQRSVHLGIWPSFANFVFCQMDIQMTLKQISVYYHCRTVRERAF